MNWKQYFIRLWPLAALPSMALFLVVIFWARSGSAFSTACFGWWESWRTMFLLFAPWYTAACLVIFGGLCVLWLQQPNRKTFAATFIVSWGLLGFPGWYLLVVVMWNLSLSRY